jgi:hypothetical protein
MKRIYLMIVASVLLISAKSYSQNYYYLENHPPAFSFPTKNPPVLLTVGATNDQLSNLFKIPFPFKFYGKTVTQFAASMNGYITFDKNATTAYANNSVLPSTKAPANSIFAFWDEFNLKANVSGSNGGTIYTWTDSSSYATTGIVRQVIDWARLTPKGGTLGTDYEYFILILSSDNTFDVYNYYRNSNYTLSGTVGVQKDATTGTMIPGSPNLTLTNTSPLYYHFAYGYQTPVDVWAFSSSLKSPVVTSASTAIDASMVNYGADTITSMDFNYSVDGGSTVTESLTGLSFLGSGQQIYTHASSKPWTGATPGQFHVIKIWTSNYNGGTLNDSMNTNDTLTKVVFVNNGVSGTKRVLIEEGTGAWCGFCPDGALNLNKIIENNPNGAIGISYHNNDGMSNSDGNAVTAHFKPAGFPFGMVDRVYYTGEGVTPSRPWDTKVTSQLSSKTPVDIKITPTWNNGSKTVSVKVDCKFLDYAPTGDIRLNVCMVEDSVRGDDGFIAGQNSYYYAYTQHNYYSKHDPSGGAGGSSHPLYNEDNAMVGFMHNHVLKSNITGDPFGDNSVIPTAPVPNTTYTGTYTYTFLDMTNVDPAAGGGSGKYTYAGKGHGENKPYNSYIVAFVSYFDNNDLTAQNVLNTASARIPGVTGIQDVENSKDLSAEVYPNPANGVSRIELNLPSLSKVNVEIFNSLGQKVEDVQTGTFTEGLHSFYFDASTYANGVYFVNISTGDTKMVKRFVVAK